MDTVLQWCGVVVLAYLLGSIPNGMILAGLRGVDLRTVGSGKTGATNASRVLGCGAGLLVLAADAAKGALAVWGAGLLPWPTDGWHVTAQGAAAVAVVAGHCWSVWLRLFTRKWSGGRGVATALGVILAIHPLAAVIATGVAVGVILVTRYVSLGSLVGATVGALAVVVLVLLQWLSPWFVPTALVVAPMIIALHHDNIRRLVAGTERKLTFSPQRTAL